MYVTLNARHLNCACFEFFRSIFIHFCPKRAVLSAFIIHGKSCVLQWSLVHSDIWTVYHHKYQKVNTVPTISYCLKNELFVLWYVASSFFAGLWWNQGSFVGFIQTTLRASKIMVWYFKLMPVVALNFIIFLLTVYCCKQLSIQLTPEVFTMMRSLAKLCTGH